MKISFKIIKKYIVFFALFFLAACNKEAEELTVYRLPTSMVDEKYIIGKAEFILFPFHHIGKIG